MIKMFCDCCGKEMPDMKKFYKKEFSILLNSIPYQIKLEWNGVASVPDCCEWCVISKTLERLQQMIDNHNKANLVKITPPPTEPKLTADDRIGILQSALKDACEEAFKAQDILTRDQFVEALMQAIKCGDFVKYVRVTDGAQQVIYLPFQREQELEGKIKELDTKLRAAMGILDRVQPATIDRDIRSASIENICRDIRLLKEDI
jgi:hypothetical protein